MEQVNSDLVQLVRLMLSQSMEDVRLYVARLIRRYRNSEPALAEALDDCLRLQLPQGSPVMRNTQFQQTLVEEPPPATDEGGLSLLKFFAPVLEQEKPIFTDDLENKLIQLIQERLQSQRLSAAGLYPTRSAIFIGPPGVGKTLTARWVATQLRQPLYVLDLTAVMSSFLGKSGGNLRVVLDFAKSRPCVLLLDEIDSIAKKRSDDSDVGELKRLVTVILQEVDAWPASSLLLAATNHPDLIDPALWRRFDLVIEFPSPAPQAIEPAIRRFLGRDFEHFESWIGILAFALQGQSFSDIERMIQRFRRALALNSASPAELVEQFVRTVSLDMPRNERIEYAVLLAQKTKFSQHLVSDLTGVSRDTIRKHLSFKTTFKRRHNP